MSCLPEKPRVFSTSISTARAMRIPSSLSGHVLPLHGSEAREEVFDDAGHNVAYMGLVVRGRRAFEEHEGVTIPRLLESLLEDLMCLLPLIEDLELEVAEMDIRWAAGEIVCCSWIYQRRFLQAAIVPVLEFRVGSKTR